MKFDRTLLVLVSSIIGCQLLTAQQPKPPRAAEPPIAQPGARPPQAPESPAPPKAPHAQQPQLQPSQPGWQPNPMHQPKPPEVRFDLDFPGGTPAQLIEYIEKESGISVNAVIPNDLADMELPPLKMKQVTVPQLFEALLLASIKSERYLSQYSSGGQPMWGQKETHFGFKTKSPGPDAVWYFFHDRIEPPSPPPVASRFYNIDTGGKTYTIQDITTAIKTGWDLLGVKDQPTLKYHPETKLLIAVGQREHLELIDSVLRELGMRTDSLRPPTQVPPKKDGDSPTK